jgi:MFS family permease
MNDGARRVQRTYLLLTLLATLAASFIWGVNTLFLLDAGLNNTEAFAANAFFTAGMVLFEVPTGVVADTWGRRASYLLGAFTLLASTLLYLWMWQIEASLFGWAIASIAIGLGFTFFSGAVEAWLVDALAFHGHTDNLEGVFAKGQSTTGVAMLSGSVAGGYVAQLTNLGVPYLMRAVMLVLVLAVAFVMMKDLGFEPRKGQKPTNEMRRIVKASVDNGLRNRPVRWLMLAAPFSGGVGIYVFYAMQPYLLELFGDETAYGIAGLAAAIVAGAQILGGFLVPVIRRMFARRTHVLLFSAGVSVLVLAAIGLTGNFWVAIALLILWSLTLAASVPMRQAFMNGEIDSEQRATVLSFDSLMSSTGGVVAQPALGRAADVWSYGASYVVSAGIQVVALPFVYFARREEAASDPIEVGAGPIIVAEGEPD